MIPGQSDTIFGSIINLDSAGTDALFAAAREQDLLEDSYLTHHG